MTIGTNRTNTTINQLLRIGINRRTRSQPLNLAGAILATTFRKIFFQVKDNKVAGHLENILRSWPSLLALLQGNHSTIDEVLTLLQFSVDRENNTVSINSTLNLSFFFSEGLDGLEKDEAE